MRKQTYLLGGQEVVHELPVVVGDIVDGLKARAAADPERAVVALHLEDVPGKAVLNALRRVVPKVIPWKGLDDAVVGDTLELELFVQAFAEESHIDRAVREATLAFLDKLVAHHHLLAFRGLVGSHLSVRADADLGRVPGLGGIVRVLLEDVARVGNCELRFGANGAPRPALGVHVGEVPHSRRGHEAVGPRAHGVVGVARAAWSTLNEVRAEGVRAQVADHALLLGREGEGLGNGHEGASDEHVRASHREGGRATGTAGAGADAGHLDAAWPSLNLAHLVHEAHVELVLLHHLLEELEVAATEEGDDGLGRLGVENGLEKGLGKLGREPRERQIGGYLVEATVALGGDCDQHHLLDGLALVVAEELVKGLSELLHGLRGRAGGHHAVVGAGAATHHAAVRDLEALQVENEVGTKGAVRQGGREGGLLVHKVLLHCALGPHTEAIDDLLRVLAGVLEVDVAVRELDNVIDDPVLLEQVFEHPVLRGDVARSHLMRHIIVHHGAHLAAHSVAGLEDDGVHATLLEDVRHVDATWASANDYNCVPWFGARVGSIAELVALAALAHPRPIVLLH
mmetsp:Transcript_2477/g.6226  ORF Transcript_2477/g.6226 Transcript_2477/m.6226 type:complete len:571 (-) Transcript_2477:79-1791(-)